MNPINYNERHQKRDESPDTPFGEDITNPDSRTMPLEFHGEWVRDLSDCQTTRSATRKVISGDHIVVGENVQRVVAVRFIDTGKVAVVTLPAETDQKEYSLFYFGVSEDGNSLADLENMDWVLYRCRTAE
jgi:hypothetical protein